MTLNAKGRMTVPAALREKYHLHAGDEAGVVEEGGALRVVRIADAESHGERMAGGYAAQRPPRKSAG